MAYLGITIYGGSIRTLKLYGFLDLDSESKHLDEAWYQALLFRSITESKLIQLELLLALGGC